MKNLLKFRPLLIVFLACLLPAAHAAPGDLDPTFGNAGIVRRTFGGADDKAQAVAFQSDGKMIVAGYAQNHGRIEFLTVRYNTDGSLDPSFGEGGMVYTRIGLGNARANAVLVQADGKIAVAGYIGDFTNTDFALVRFQTDGSLDLSFGSGGKVTTDFVGGNDAVAALGLVANGKIVAAGSSGGAGSTDSDFAIARYNPDGSLDLSFSGDGKLTTPGTGQAFALVINGFSQLILAGTGDAINTLAVARYNADGSLDPAFSGDGIVLTAEPPGERIALAIESHTFLEADKYVVVTGNRLLRFSADGTLETSIVTAGAGNSGLFIRNSGLEADRIYVCGSAPNPSGGSIDFTLSRYLLSGALDTAFGNGGTVYTPVGASNDVSMAMQARSGRLLVAGYAVGDGVQLDVALVAYNQANGSLDSTFNGNGKRRDDFGNQTATARGVAIQADRKIVVAGKAGGDFGLMRFQEDGSLDSTFGSGGKVTTDINGSDSGTAVALQTNGKIIVAGTAGNQFALARYNADGSLDSGFGAGGRVSTTLGSSSEANAVALQTDGKIVAAGFAVISNNQDFAVVRYNPDGTLDTSFGGTGKVITGIGTGSDIATSVKIQPDGKILAAGYGTIGSFAQFALVRYNANGSFDAGFGSFGTVITDFLAADDGAYGLALQPDGKIVAAGVACDGSTCFIAAARYLSNGSLDPTFDGDGKLLTQVGVVYDIARAVAIQSDGKILAAGFSLIGGGDAVFSTVRYNSNGALDNSYGFGGRMIFDLSESDDIALALALDSNGRAVLAGDADSDFGVIRLQGDDAPTVLNAVSRKGHGAAGTFDLDLPVTGAPGIECRSGGAGGDHTVIFTFANAVTFNSAAVSTGAGSVSSSSGSGTTEVTVNLTGVTNAQTVTVTLSGVNNGTSTSDVGVQMGVLIGDTNGDGVVNSGDALQTRGRSGQATAAANFRSDVNADGFINSGDTLAVRSRSGTSLP